MKRLLWLVTWTIFCMIITACSSGNEATQDNSSMAVEYNKSEEALDESMKGDAAVEKAETNENAIQKAEFTDQRKIIYSAHLAVEVRDFSEAEKKIERLVQQEKGYIVNSVVNSYENERKNGSITARIPQVSFQQFLDQVAEIGNEVKEKSINSEDVTEEYVDLDARLKAKQTVKKRLETFMEKAETTKDLLAVSEQLAKVQEEMEQIQGRINYLENRSDYSTVTISLMERSLKAEDIDAKDLNTWARAKQLLVNTVNAVISGISGLVIVLIGLSPIILPLLAVAGWFIYARRKKKKANEKAGWE